MVLPALGELELAVLEHLWDAGESDVVGAHRAVGKRRGISANTVGSALERLHRKGLLSRTKVSHAFRYRPAIDREAFRARIVVEAAGGMKELASDGLLAAFVDIVAESDAEALDQLEELVQRKRKERRR